MTTTTTGNPNEIYVLGRDEGPRLHVLNNLATVKVTAGDSGSMSAVEFAAPQGFGPPLHSHRTEDELVVVLEGEVAFRSGDDETIARDGACAYLPHGIPHTFQVLSETARMLSVTSSATEVPQFDLMFAALGVPTDDAVIPEPSAIDPGHVAMVCAQHGIDVLGPPPPPLAD